ncbi:MAG: DUF502 domain-containing protein [Xanthobacteraceae bacterium]
MNPSDNPSGPEPVQLPARTGLAGRIRNYFLTGLVIAAPLAITIYIVWWLVHWIDGWVKPLIPASYDPDYYLPFSLPGVGVVLAFVFITLLGFLTANLLGRTLISYGERLLGRMPLVRTVYGGLKQMFETMLTSKTATFSKVVLIEYPRRETWSLAFVAMPATGEVRDVLQTNDEFDNQIMTVYVPTTPNPTSGYLLFAKRKEMIELDMTIEEAAKLVITGGLVTPEYDKRIKRPADKARFLRSRAASD